MNNENIDIITTDDVDTFVFHKEWLFEGFQKLPTTQQAQILLDAIRKSYNLPPFFEDDAVVDAFSDSYETKIRGSKQAYVDRVNQGQKGGRKKKISDNQIYRLCREGKTIPEIIKELDCSESTIRHSDGYRRRKEPDLIFDF